MTQITDSLTGQFTFGYDGLSRRTSLTRPNGVNTSYGYDSLSRLLSVLHQNGTTTLDGADYTYDSAGNRTAKTNLLNNITENYTYDTIYQLTQVIQGATTTENYSYDAVGNRLSSLGMSYNYNTSNELTSTTNATFTYDNNGNTLSKTDSTGTRNYSWDFEDRLTSAVVPGVGTTTFRYDPFGRRIQKSGPNGTVNYVYDGANTIQEVDSSGNQLAHYAQGAGIDEPLVELRSGASAFYEQDGLSSVTSLSNSTAGLTNTYTYDTFGNVTALTGSFVNPYLYTGRDYDSETGLRYYRARYYDPVSGRFLSEDPLGLAVGLNYYRYVENSPPNLIDPLGWQSYHGPYGQQVQPPITLIFPILPNGGFFYYGNWGGPGWTGGQLLPYEDLTPQQQANLAAPIDDQDACYMEHDLCYSRARVRNKCTSKDRPTKQQNEAENHDEASCDLDLSLCLRDVNSSRSTRGRNPLGRVGQFFFSAREIWR